MSLEDFVLDPIDRITVDAIGKPGKRIFYIQASKGSQQISLLIEKFQLQSLLKGAKDFFKEIYRRYPNLDEPIISFQENEMRIQSPVDPLFQVGDLGLAYDENRDLACVFASEAVLDDDVRVARFWCSREKLLTFIRWGAIVIQRGRPICPQCRQPMDPNDHFCPKKNGHKRGKK